MFQMKEQDKTSEKINEVDISNLPHEEFKVRTTVSSLVVQWLGLGAFTAVARVQSLVRELRSQSLEAQPKKKGNDHKDDQQTREKNE